MIHRGVTVRALLAVIALLAVGIAVYRERIRQSNIVPVYSRRAAQHSQLAEAIDRRRRDYRELLKEARSLKQARRLRGDIERYDSLWGYHSQLAASYRDAASNPWFSVPVHPGKPKWIRFTLEEQVFRDFGVMLPPASAHTERGLRGSNAESDVIDVDRNWLRRLTSGTAPWGTPWRDGPIDSRIVATWPPPFFSHGDTLKELFGETGSVNDETGLVNDARLRYTVEDLSIKERGPTAAREPYTSGRILIADMKMGRLWCARWRRSKPR